MKSKRTASVHRQICVRNKCAFLDRVDYEDDCSFCPNGHFGQYERSKCKDVEEKSFGLGDMVATVATPIARVLKLSCIDPKTHQLRPESKCAKRKQKLNNL